MELTWYSLVLFLFLKKIRSYILVIDFNNLSKFLIEMMLRVKCLSVHIHLFIQNVIKNKAKCVQTTNI
jgi:competence protein ComGC